MASRFKRQRAKALNPASAGGAATSTPAFGDEDDYLSASFVVEEPNKPRGKRAQQEADPERGRGESVLSKKDIAKKMEDRREEGLQQKIGEENAGFKLLMKLGYKGGGLGKDGEGTTKPLMPELKQGRAGLGKESESKRRKEEHKERAKRKASRDAQQEVQRREHFRMSMAAQFVDRRLQQDLSRARRLVESLDETSERTRSIMWPDEEKESLDEDPNGGGGSYFNDEGRRGGIDTDAAGTTAGPSQAWDGTGSTGNTLLKEPEEAKGEASTSEEGMGEDGGLREEWDVMTADEKLSACLAYLRASYSYCMYCACRYEGPRDLQDSCPGPSRSDHDNEEM
ncbi:unnamed protein product [Ectocarpus sp. 12 AP-2014]